MGPMIGQTARTVPSSLVLRTRGKFGPKLCHHIFIKKPNTRNILFGIKFGIATMFKNPLAVAKGIIY